MKQLYDENNPQGHVYQVVRPFVYKQDEYFKSEVVVVSEKEDRKFMLKNNLIQAYVQ